MSLERLNKAAERAEFYKQLIADLDSVAQAENTRHAIGEKIKRYRQYVALHEKRFDEALKTLTNGGA